MTRAEYQEERSQRIAELNHRLNALYEKERMLKEQKFGYFKKSLLLSNPMLPAVLAKRWKN